MVRWQASGPRLGVPWSRQQLGRPLRNGGHVSATQWTGAAVSKKEVDLAAASKDEIAGRGTAPFKQIDHVQLAMPPGEEARAREFYAGLLEMSEISKPPELAKRGGCWFVSGKVQIHLGIEVDFHPAKKAHPALRCSHYEALISRLGAAGIDVHEANDIPGVRRAHIHDPFGNRIELID